VTTRRGASHPKCSANRGAPIGELIVVGTDTIASRELALRMPWFVYGAASILLLACAGPRLTTAAFATARSAASTTG